MGDELITNNQAVEGTVGESADEVTTAQVDVVEEVSESAEELEGQGAKEDTPEKKVFTQEEVDKIVQKRLDREARKKEREERQASEPLNIESKLNSDDFDTTEAYIDALAKEKAEAIIKKRQNDEVVNKIEDAWQDQVTEAKAKYEDFVQVAFSPAIPITQAMGDAIKESDIGAELAYYLGKNPKEAKIIAELSPVRQIKALVALEARVAEKLKEPPGSKAPAPIPAEKTGKTIIQKFDTTDPKSVKQMSASEWIAADRKRRMAKLQQQGFK